MRIPSGGVMAKVVLRSPLRDLTGGRSSVDVQGGTVGEVLGKLEGEYPKLTGWVRDEQGRIRRHVNVFLNGERVRTDAEVGVGDTIQILPAISGGSDASNG